MKAHGDNEFLILSVLGTKVKLDGNGLTAYLSEATVCPVYPTGLTGWGIIEKQNSWKCLKKSYSAAMWHRYPVWYFNEYIKKIFRLFVLQYSKLKFKIIIKTSYFSHILYILIYILKRIIIHISFYYVEYSYTFWKFDLRIFGAVWEEAIFDQFDVHIS